jgi:hypothetical protein
MQHIGVKELDGHLIGEAIGVSGAIIAALRPRHVQTVTAVRVGLEVPRILSSHSKNRAQMRRPSIHDDGFRSVACLRAFSLRIDSSLNELHSAVASSRWFHQLL